MHGIERLLHNYAKYHVGDRINDPGSYITYIRKQPRFRCGLLDHLPRYAIVLHDARSEEFLTRVGYSTAEWTRLDIGMTDPNAIYHVYEKGKQPAFLLNRGMPGCGGIATQVAELCALGAKEIIHIGTCGLVGEGVEGGRPVVSRGAYKDAGAVMLSPVDDVAPIAYADADLSKLLVVAGGALLSDAMPAHVFGYTIPIFYHQPIRLIHDLITGEVYPGGPPVSYFEMEGAGLFATCALMQAHGASLLIASDRYRLVDGEVSHSFEMEDDDVGVAVALQIALDALRAKSLEGNCSAAAVPASIN